MPNEKIYVGRAKYIDTQYGEICKIWLTPEGVEAINANVDNNGGINLNMSEMRNPDRGRAARAGTDRSGAIQAEIPSGMRVVTGVETTAAVLRAGTTEDSDPTPIRGKTTATAMVKRTATRRGTRTTTDETGRMHRRTRQMSVRMDSTSGTSNAGRRPIRTIIPTSSMMTSHSENQKPKFQGEKR